MADLEQRIRQWRRALSETTGCAPEVIDELESHLRDAVQQLTREGHTPEQALGLAAARLGSPQALAPEFAKVGPRGESWLPARAAPPVFVVGAALVLGYLLARVQAGTLGPLLAGHVACVLFGYTALYFVGVLGVCYVAVRPFHALRPGQTRSLRRAALRLSVVSLILTAAGILLGGLWARENLGRFWVGDLREYGGLLVLAWSGALISLLWRGPARVPAAMQLGILGNVVVSLAWFGANLVSATKSYGFAPAFTWLIVFALSQLALFALGFAPAAAAARFAGAWRRPQP